MASSELYARPYDVSNITAKALARGDLPNGKVSVKYIPPKKKYFWDLEPGLLSPESFPSKISPSFEAVRLILKLI